MRDRLLVVLVSLSVDIVAVVLVERAYTTSAALETHEQSSLARTTAVVASLLAERDDEVTPALLDKVVGPGEHATFVAPDGRTVEAGDAAPAEEGEALVASRAVDGGGSLTLTRNASTVESRVADALLPLALTGLGVVTAAAFLALWLSRRLSRPFVDLATAAERIGRGDFTVEVPRQAVPEADAVARALRASAEDLDLLVRREREFAAHASHELRTPITAIRLELEDLMLSRQTPPEVVGRLTDALGQLERLSGTVGELLDTSRRDRLGSRTEIDLSALVRDTVGRWRGLAPDRPISQASDGVVAARMPPGALLEVMDVLLGNAVQHGEGAITVTVAQNPAYIELTVTDQGDRERAAKGVRGPGADPAGGLGTAGEIAASLGGRLRLSEEPSTTFSLVLPRGPRENLAS